MDYYKYLVKKIGEIVSENECDFILYPFGERGALAKGILNVLYGIQEKVVIDNILCDTYEQIKSLEYLKESKLNNYKILITSDRIEFYEEIREKLYAIVEKEQCLELLPTPKSVVQSRKIREKVIKKMEEEGIVEEKPIYHPKKTKSNFYLPLLLDPDLIQSSILLEDDYYERKNLDRIFISYRNGAVGEEVSGGVVLDIGANIGNHTLYFCNEWNAEKVYCFEPIKKIFSILQENIRLNHLEQKVELNQVGLGEKKGKGSACYFTYNLGGTYLVQDTDGCIQIEKLDDIGIREKVSFIKIDVEGMESSVLKGGMKLIKKNYPYIMVESFEHAFYEVRELLCGIGYTYESLDSGVNWLFSPNKCIAAK